MWMKVAAVTRIMHCMISRKHTESVTQKAAVCMQLWCLPYGMDMLLTGECLQYTYYEPVTNGHTVEQKNNRAYINSRGPVSGGQKTQNVWLVALRDSSKTTNSCRAQSCPGKR
jgi:hypothetical protein